MKSLDHKQTTSSNVKKGIGILAVIAGSILYYIFMLPDLRFNWNHILQSSVPSTPALPDYQELLNEIDVDCRGIIRGDKLSVEKAKRWKYNSIQAELEISKAKNKCHALKKLFGFRVDLADVSIEELKYPLAYGAIVYKNFIQVMFMLSAFYRPHNEYCIAVSGSAEKSFKIAMDEVASCFDNVHVLHRPHIEWGSFEIINSTWVCVGVLARSKTDWMYYQQLSGADVPLKTNLEMVRILKQLNNTVNSEFSTFQTDRLEGKKAEKGWQLLRFLNDTYIPDEAFWATLTGNEEIFPVPGGTSAEKWIKFEKDYRAKHMAEVDNYMETKLRDASMHYYLARHQVWYSNCGGELMSASCVFGVDDLANILKQPHLIAHKMYLDFQPAAFFCVLKEIREREKKPKPLNLTLYAELPQVELSSGVPYEKLKHPLWMIW
ncbi:unnamed protein product [Cylicocyclus nassatus]|uniref:Uncharacterized protein n=1 Tax=Cylicocyclus nassatus TaxID=53992 RepID=A0AA36GNW4_CYLNA|nr:unnamed protein product [Cylicocyclus nassatus]